MSKAGRLFRQVFPPLLVGAVYAWLYFDLTVEMNQLELKLDRLERTLAEHVKHEAVK